MQVCAVAFERLVRLHTDEDVEIAARATSLARFSEARVSQPRSLFNARRHLDRHLLLYLAAPAAVARLARVDDDSAGAPAARADAGGHELAQHRITHRTHLSGPVALWTLRRRRLVSRS